MTLVEQWWLQRIFTGLDAVARYTHFDDRHTREIDLHWIYVHAPGEYARHCGRALAGRTR